MLRLKRLQRKFFAASFFWAILLVALSLQPEQLVERMLPRETLRSVAHAMAYAVFAFFLSVYFRSKRSVFNLRMSHPNLFLVSFVISAAWGGLNEWLQLYSPDRTADWADLGWDMLGSLMGLILFLAFKASDRTCLVQPQKMKEENPPGPV